MTAVPDLTLNLPSGARSAVKVQPSHIKRVSDASERLMANPPMAKKRGQFRRKFEAVGRGAKTVSNGEADQKSEHEADGQS